MRNTSALVMNTVTGRVDNVPRTLLDHAFFGKNLVEVEPGTKPYADGLYRPRTLEEFSEAHPEKLASVEITEAEYEPLITEDNE